MPLSDEIIHPGRRRARRRPGGHAVAVCGALVGIALLAAGCGSSGGSPGVASVGSTTTASSQSSSARGGSPAAGGGAVGGGGSAASSFPGGGGHGGFALVAASGNRANELKFSACMRTNGVPAIPDPNAQGVIQANSSEGIDPSSTIFQKALQKCQKYSGRGTAPTPAQQSQFQAKALAYSACMRSHGEPSFPDPQISGGHVSLQLKRGPGGLNPSSPIFQKAQKACQADLPVKGAAVPPPASAAASG